ncbi:MAG: hypothetical protein QOD99_2763 [Chthoniobacter sp.]|nr:hypothetical protein [Chthoniobacter sp.]
MAKDQTKRIRPSTLQDDRDGFAALKAIGNYTPANQEFTVAKIQALQQAMVDQRDLEAQAQAALDAARDDATAAEWAFHNSILGAKDQVKAQFGDDSNEYSAMGLTKKSERQSPTRSAPPAATPKP